MHTWRTSASLFSFCYAAPATRHFALKPTAHGAPPTSADAFADGESSTVATRDSKLWE